MRHVGCKHSSHELMQASLLHTSDKQLMLTSIGRPGSAEGHRACSVCHVYSCCYLKMIKRRYSSTHVHDYGNERHASSRFMQWRIWLRLSFSNEML